VTGAVPHVLLGSGEGCIMALGLGKPWKPPADPPEHGSSRVRPRCV